MADRAHYYRPLESSITGNLVQNITVRVVQPGTTDLITEPLYVANVGSETMVNPFISETGVINFYLDLPKRVRLGVTVPGSTEVFLEDVDVMVPTLPAVVTASTGTPTTALILTDSDGVRWEVTVDTTGHLTTEVLA